MSKYTDTSLILGRHLAASNFPFSIYPSTYVASGPVSSFVRFSILHGVSDASMHASQGQLIFEIFTLAGEYPEVIADALESALVARTLEGALELYGSSKGSTVPDSADKTLRVTKYIINFNYFGE